MSPDGQENHLFDGDEVKKAKKDDRTSGISAALM